MKNSNYIIIRPKSFFQRLMWLIFVPAYKFDDFLAEDELHVYLNKVKSYTLFFNMRFLIYEGSSYETIIYFHDKKNLEKINKINLIKYLFEKTKNDHLVEKVLFMLFIFAILFFATFGSVKYILNFVALSKIYKTIVIFIASFLNLTLPLFLIDSTADKILSLPVKILYYLVSVLLLLINIVLIYRLF